MVKTRICFLLTSHCPLKQSGKNWIFASQSSAPLSVSKLIKYFNELHFQTNASSGMGVTELSKSTFLELQRKKVHHYVLMKESLG
ncbi:hypothetical protein I3842_11G206900 [Carya illinoinensis]|uniref:Uncharacterized protein n=1 Tax=Carya illinoinensis TaxID=32201 RepID=A0A922DTM1_CARIL|nr:hypothetical protein I3842_11G206900 [Carya illinoinensis]